MKDNTNYHNTIWQPVPQSPPPPMGPPRTKSFSPKLTRLPFNYHSKFFVGYSQAKTRYMSMGVSTPRKLQNSSEYQKEQGKYNHLAARVPQGRVSPQREEPQQLKVYGQNFQRDNSSSSITQQIQQMNQLQKQMNRDLSDIQEESMVQVQQNQELSQIILKVNNMLTGMETIDETPKTVTVEHKMLTKYHNNTDITSHSLINLNNNNNATSQSLVNLDKLADIWRDTSHTRLGNNSKEQNGGINGWRDKAFTNTQLNETRSAISKAEQRTIRMSSDPDKMDVSQIRASVLHSRKKREENTKERSESNKQQNTNTLTHQMNDTDIEITVQGQKISGSPSHKQQNERFKSLLKMQGEIDNQIQSHPFSQENTETIPQMESNEGLEHQTVNQTIFQSEKGDLQRGPDQEEGGGLHIEITIDDTKEQTKQVDQAMNTTQRLQNQNSFTESKSQKSNLLGQTQSLSHTIRASKTGSFFNVNQSLRKLKKNENADLDLVGEEVRTVNLKSDKKANKQAMQNGGEATRMTPIHERRDKININIDTSPGTSNKLFRGDMKFNEINLASMGFRDQENFESKSVSSVTNPKNDVSPVDGADPQISQIKLKYQYRNYDSNQSLSLTREGPTVEQNPQKQRLHQIWWRNLQLQKTLVSLAIDFEKMKQTQPERVVESQNNFFELTQQQLRVLHEQQKVITECLQKDSFSQDEVEKLESMMDQFSPKSSKSQGNVNDQMANNNHEFNGKVKHYGNPMIIENLGMDHKVDKVSIENIIMQKQISATQAYDSFDATDGRQMLMPKNQYKSLMSSQDYSDVLREQDIVPNPRIIPTAEQYRQDFVDNLFKENQKKEDRYSCLSTVPRFTLLKVDKDSKVSHSALEKSPMSLTQSNPNSYKASPLATNSQIRHFREKLNERMNNFSGISEPYAKNELAEVRSSALNTGDSEPKGLISEERDLNKLNEDLEKIQNFQPFVSNKDTKQQRYDKIRHVLEIGLLNSRRTLNDKFDKFGPQQLIKDKVNMRFQQKQVDMRKSNQLTSIKENDLAMLSTQPRSLSFGLNNKPVNPFKTGKDFLSPNVLDRLKRFKWDFTKQFSETITSNRFGNQSEMVSQPLSTNLNFKSSHLDDIERLAIVQRKEYLKQSLGLNYRYGNSEEAEQLQKIKRAVNLSRNANYSFSSKPQISQQQQSQQYFQSQQPQQQQQHTSIQRLQKQNMKKFREMANKTTAVVELPKISQSLNVSNFSSSFNPVMKNEPQNLESHGGTDEHTSLTVTVKNDSKFSTVMPNKKKHIVIKAPSLSQVLSPQYSKKQNKHLKVKHKPSHELIKSVDVSTNENEFSNDSPRIKNNRMNVTEKLHQKLQQQKQIQKQNNNNGSTEKMHDTYRNNQMSHSFDLSGRMLNQISAMSRKKEKDKCPELQKVQTLTGDIRFADQKNSESRMNQKIIKPLESTLTAQRKIDDRIMCTLPADLGMTSQRSYDDSFDKEIQANRSEAELSRQRQNFLQKNGFPMNNRSEKDIETVENVIHEDSNSMDFGGQDRLFRGADLHSTQFRHSIRTQCSPAKLNNKLKMGTSARQLYLNDQIPSELFRVTNPTRVAPPEVQIQVGAKQESQSPILPNVYSINKNIEMQIENRSPSFKRQKQLASQFNSNPASKRQSPKKFRLKEKLSKKDMYEGPKNLHFKSPQRILPQHHIMTLITQNQLRSAQRKDEHRISAQINKFKATSQFDSQ